MPSNLAQNGSWLLTLALQGRIPPISHCRSRVRARRGETLETVLGINSTPAATLQIVSRLANCRGAPNTARTDCSSTNRLISCRFCLGKRTGNPFRLAMQTMIRKTPRANYLPGLTSTRAPYNRMAGCPYNVNEKAGR
jgi:hypothetical protein